MRIEPVEWTVTYPVHVEPIGRIWRRRAGFYAQLSDEPLGVYATGDAAVETIWSRFVEASYALHDAASRVHGSHERG